MSSAGASQRTSPWADLRLPARLQLRGRRLAGARAAWVAVAGLVIALFGASLPAGFAHLRTVCTVGPCTGPQLSVTGARAFEAAGLSVDAFAAYSLSVIVVFAAAYFALAGLIFWRTSQDPVALLASLMLVTFGATFPPTLDWLGASDPAWHWPSAFVRTLGLCLFFVFFYVFPDGRFVPAWTRAVVPVMVAVQASASFLPGSPLSYNSWPAPLVFLLFLGWFGTAIGAQIHRYRRVSGPVERQQTKWVVFGLAAALTGFLAVVLGGAVLPAETLRNPFGITAAVTAAYLFLLLVPLSIAVAILRHRLWDIDLLVNRALSYGTLSAAVIALYALIVGALAALFRTTDSWLVSVVATGVVAVLFQPLRARLQRAANRLVYGERDDPHAVLSRLGQRLEATLAPDAVLPTIVETIAQALKLPHASIWIVEQDTLHLAAAHGTPAAHDAIHDGQALDALRGEIAPPRPGGVDAPSVRAAVAPLGPVVLLPLSHAGVLVGALGLAQRNPSEPFSPSDRSLLRDLARQAGPVVHAVRLTSALRGSLEELRDSRQRLVTAQDEERRRIQRDLHDGLGPTLASMRLRLEGCLDPTEQIPPGVVRELEWLHALLGQATADIRRLVHHLRPPVLDQLGLVPALRQHVEQFARDAGLEARFAAEADLSIPAAAEVGVFRVAQEALVNVQKHARASRVEVRLEREGDHLAVAVLDDGVGFDAGGAAERPGTGLRSMRERADLLGGTLSIEGRAGGGTKLTLRIPTAVHAAAEA